MLSVDETLILPFVGRAEVLSVDGRLVVPLVGKAELPTVDVGRAEVLLCVGLGVEELAVPTVGPKSKQREVRVSL